MDLDDFARFWHERVIILNTYAKEFNQHLYDIKAPVMTISEYERAFWEWYNTEKKPQAETKS